MPICGEANRLKGMVTDRDIVVKALAKGKDPSSTRAGELGEGKPVTTGPAGSVQGPLKTMAQYKVRRLPVIDGHDLVGIISVADIARELEDDSSKGDLIEAISEGPPQQGVSSQEAEGFDGPPPGRPTARGGGAVPGVAPSGHGPARDAAHPSHAGQGGVDPARGHAVRAQMGRVPLRGVPRRRRGRAGQPQRAAADPLLPRGGGGGPGPASAPPPC